MIVYLQSADHEARQAKAERGICGRLSMYRLLSQQRAYCGLEAGDAAVELDRATRDLDALESAPPGTSFVSRLDSKAGKAGMIWIVDEQKREIYMGPWDGYQPPSV